MLRLGFTTEGNLPVDLTLDERRQGTYVIGTTGTGKSTLLKNIVYQDMHKDRNHGLCVLDPHGDLIDELLELVPEERIEDVILFNPMDLERPFGLNVMACNRKDPQEVRFMVSTVIGIMERIFTSWGPRLEHVLRHVLLTALRKEDATLLEVLRTLYISKEDQELLIQDLDDPILKDFWLFFPDNERLRYELVSSTLNKISPFLNDEMMRNIVGQSENTIDLQKVMDEGKILFVNLSKGDLGEDNSTLLGAVIVNLIMIAALKRKPIPVKERLPFHLIVDEFQNFATESFAILQSEARKYAVDVVVAHQYRDQLSEKLLGSTLNVGNLISFRVTGRDGFSLASQYDNTPPEPKDRYEPYYQSEDFMGNEVYIRPGLNAGMEPFFVKGKEPQRSYSDTEAEKANKLTIQPNYEAWCRLIHDPRSRGEKRKRPRLAEYQIYTENLDEIVPDEQKLRGKEIAAAIIKRSRELAKTREEVADDIRKRIGIDSKESLPANVQMKDNASSNTPPKSPRRKKRFYSSR